MAIKGRGMGIGDEKEIKRAFHEPVIIYLWPKQKMGKDFLMRGEEVGKYTRQRKLHTIY